MSPQPPKPRHRSNNDGTFDSICLSCYQTIATSYIEENLARPEVEHACQALLQPA
jgi:hypothetical protein